MRAALLLSLALLAGGCSVGSDDEPERSGPAQTATTRVEVIERSGPASGFDPRSIYERESPGVVTVISVFEGGGGLLSPDDEEGGVGSGFVLNQRGEIATNAHVVTRGEAPRLEEADEVYVQFADGNQVEAEVLGADPFADIGLLKIDPEGLTLRPLPLGKSSDVQVGTPVAAMGSPFGEPQSLSVGVVSATDRSIRSLTNFQISGAIQTDAAINPGNSGGPLVNADGEVIGVNQQIRTTSGGGEGVGFAVPVDVVRHSLAGLREGGRVEYAYLGVRSTDLYPQAVERFDLPVEKGAWLQEVARGGPAEKAGLQAEGEPVRFQTQEFVPDGDIITAIDGRRITDADDLSKAIELRRPGETVTLEVYRDGKRREVRLKLGTRPIQAPPG